MSKPHPIPSSLPILARLYGFYGQSTTAKAINYKVCAKHSMPVCMDTCSWGEGQRERDTRHSWSVFWGLTVHAADTPLQEHGHGQSYQF